MHHSVSTVRCKKHSTKHPIPILTHAAHRRRKRAMRVYLSDAYGLIVKTKRKEFCIIPTVLNVTIAAIIGAALLWGAYLVVVHGIRFFVLGLVKTMMLFPTFY